eukprot:389477_1
MRDGHGLKDLLVNPALRVRLPGEQLLRLEPEGELLVGVLDAVAAVADVAADVEGEVAADRARGRVSRVRGAEQDAARLDDVLALPAHGADGAAGHVLAQAGVERLRGQVDVVLLHVLHG